MITNEEKSEVAARLRERAKEHDGTEFTAVEEKFRILYALIPNAKKMQADEAMRYLADLIEPEERTCRNVTEYPDRDFE